MLIATMNETQYPGVLIVVTGANVADQKTQESNNIVRISDEKTNKTIGFNFLKVQEIIPDLVGNGEIELNADQIKQLNDALQNAGFDGDLQLDDSPKFVVGEVKEIEDHPDSDHLKITKTEIDGGKVEQIVCGAPNVAQGQKVVVAKVGAMMPNGQIIWRGKLRGVKSDGMLCSARELGIPNAPQVHGILVLPEDTPVGKKFDFSWAASLI